MANSRPCDLLLLLSLREEDNVQQHLAPQGVGCSALFGHCTRELALAQRANGDEYSFCNGGGPELFLCTRACAVEGCSLMER